MSGKIRLTVTTGPDRGKSEAFENGPVRIGRDPSNEFSLTDGFVSNFHGRIVFGTSEDDYLYEDLKSRHGSLVTLPNDGNKRNDIQKNKIVNGAMLYIGCTEILITMIEDKKDSNPDETIFGTRNYPRNSMLRPTGLINLDTHGEYDDERAGNGMFVTSSYDRRSSVSTRIGSSDRILDLFFDLSGKLNAATSLDEVLDLIVETTFDAFASANYFSITMINEEGELEMEPYISRLRGKPTKGRTVDEELITSRSIMLRVLQKREGILFTDNDTNGYDPSQSMFMAKISASMCVPLIGQHSLLGVLQVETRGRSAIFTEHELDILTLLGSSVAFAIERAKLNGDLEEILEKFVDASVSAIEARDPTTAGHSFRVADYTLDLAQEVNLIKTGPWGQTLLSSEEMRELRYASLLHDFGKICVKENVLQKSARLVDGLFEQIRIRFDLITALFEAQSLRTLIGANTGPLRINTDQPLADHNQRIAAYRNQMEQDIQFLEYVNTASFLKDEEIDRLRAIAARTYTSPTGEPQPFLTQNELDNLSIKRGTLNPEEWVEMRSHAGKSEEYLGRIPWTKNLKQIPRIAGSHHEKLDGSGYPRGLSGDEIPVQVRMMTVADIFDALTASDRPYRKAAPIEGAVHVLYAEAHQAKLDMDLVQIFEAKVIPVIKYKYPNRFHTN